MGKRKQQQTTEEQLVVIGEEEPAEQFTYVRLFVGIFFLLLTIVILVGTFFTDYVSVLQPVRTGVVSVFGKAAMLFPVILAIVGTSILSDVHYGWLSTKNFGMLLIALSLCGILHRQSVPVKQELFPHMLTQGGGLIGGLVTLPLNRYFDSTLVFSVLGVALLCGVVLLVPYLDLFRAIAYPFKWIKNYFFGSSEDDEDENEEDAEDEYEEIVNDEVVKEPVISAPVATKKYSGSLSAKEIIQRRLKNEGSANTAKTNSPHKDESTIHGLYKREEFKQYTDGIRKESVFKKVLGTSKNIYKHVKPEDFEADRPSDWQEHTIPYGTGKNIFGASMYTNPQPAQESKVIPLRQEEPQKVAPPEPVVIKHYRPSEANDVEEADISRLTKPAVKPRVKKVSYRFPKIDLLDKPRHLSSAAFEKDIQRQCGILEQTLEDFRVHANIVGVTRGPSVTRFEVQPASGVKVSSITNLADDIALKLAASGVRIEAPIPGKAAVGIEVPNLKTDPVSLREIVSDDSFKNWNSPVCVGLGRDINGSVIAMDIDRMPHLLIAGSTGSGKSVCVNTIICNILFRARPDEVKLILVDPKVVELSNYNGIPHLLTPVVTDMKKAASALHWAVKEMERRYSLFAEEHAREINSYNLKATEKLPYIVIIIDELSDLMMVARIDVEDAILRLAQKARAAGIHLILATQRPSVDVITGIIKANIPSRIAFAVSSQTDSRTILDTGGAEKLIGHGDMLYFPIGVNKPMRVQGAFVSDDEINRIVEFVTQQALEPAYVEEVTTQKLSSDQKDNGMTDSNSVDDDIFPEVLRLVMDTGQASASMLQRRFRVGYTRAARLVDTLEELGVVGQSAGSKPRELIMSREEIMERFFNE